MVLNKKVTGKASSIPGGLFAGAVVSLVSTLVLAMVTAWLVHTEILREASIGYCVIGILLLSAICGTWIANRKIKRQKLLVCLMSGVIYYAILLSMTALFFGGQYTGMGVTALVVLSGCMVLCVPAPQKGSGQRRLRKYKI